RSARCDTGSIVWASINGVRFIFESVPIFCIGMWRLKMGTDSKMNLTPFCRCDAAIWVPSSNCDARPHAPRIELLLIHNISLPPGEFGGPWIDALFQNRLDPEAHPYFQEISGLEVSAHFLVRRDGELRQYVATDMRAWHAGVSSWKGRSRCNDFSIGIELE